MKVEVLLSCMNQKDRAIINRSNLEKTHTLVVNQCDITQERIIEQTPYLCWLDTPTQGLSVSRNLALANTKADIAIIADDDEVFENNLSEKVTEVYKNLPQADIIIFSLSNTRIKFGNRPRKLSKWELLKVVSVRITFKIDVIRNNKITFDPLLGSGSGNGSGEENKFLLDCYKKGLQIYFSPCTIAYLDKSSKSLWFRGYDEKYFFLRGQSTRYIFGFWFACVYGIYFLVFKHKEYSKDISIFKAAGNLFLGILKNELKK